MICSPALFAQVTVRGQLQPPAATTGETVVYAVVIEHSDGIQPQILPPEIDPATGLSEPVRIGTQTMQSVSVINGTMTRVVQTIVRYSITPSRVGEFEIPGAKVYVDGKTYNAEPAKLQVREAPKAAALPVSVQGKAAAPLVPGNPQLQRKLGGAIFVLPQISNMNPYNGEQIRASFHLCIDPDLIKAAGLTDEFVFDRYELPGFANFISDVIYPFQTTPRPRTTEIGGKDYIEFPLFETALVSTKTGKLTIDPFQIQVNFAMRTNHDHRTSSDPFDDPFFSGPGLMFQRTTAIVARSAALEIDVKPLPTAEKPPEFSGAVGAFEAEATLDKSRAKANEDTLELTLNVKGIGDLASVSPPTFPRSKQFGSLGKPRSENSSARAGEQIVSTKQVKYTLRPLVPGQHEIPPIDFWFFNPEKEAYEKTSSKPLLIDIQPGSAPLRTAGVNDTDGDTETESEDQLSTVTQNVLRISNPFVVNNANVYWLALVPGLLVFLSSFGVAWIRGSARTAKPLAAWDSGIMAAVRQAESPAEGARILAQAVRANLADLVRQDAQTLTPEGVEAAWEQLYDSPDKGADAAALLERVEELRYLPVEPDRARVEAAATSAGEFFGAARR